MENFNFIWTFRIPMKALAWESVGWQRKDGDHMPGNTDTGNVFIFSCTVQRSLHCRAYIGGVENTVMIGLLAREGKIQIHVVLLCQHQSFIFTVQTREWHRPSHRTLGKKAKRMNYCSKSARTKSFAQGDLSMVDTSCPTSIVWEKYGLHHTCNKLWHITCSVFIQQLSWGFKPTMG